MEILSELKKIDDVLMHLYEQKDRNFLLFTEIYDPLEWPFSFDKNELVSILNKLEKDKYVDVDIVNVVHKSSKINRYSAEEKRYRINFEGGVFILMGGYAKQEGFRLAGNIRVAKLENDQRVSRNQMNALTGIIAAGTLVAAIYYLYFFIRDLCQCVFWFQK